MAVLVCVFLGFCVVLCVGVLCLVWVVCLCRVFALASACLWPRLPLT